MAHSACSGGAAVGKLASSQSHSTGWEIVMRVFNRRVVVGLTATAIALMAGTSSADHAWGNYHWARTSNPLTLQVGKNVDSKWEQYLDEAIDDWQPSSVLNLTEVAGRNRPKNCRPTGGRIEVCNAAY